MLYKDDLNVYDIQDFVANALKNSVEYRDYCILNVGSELNFTTDAPLHDEDLLPQLPYCSIHGGAETQDKRVQEFGHVYEIALVFGIEDDEVNNKTQESPSILENGIKKYTSARKVEGLAKESIKAINAKMRATGINSDYDIQLLTAQGTKTTTGEAVDLNYILTLGFGYIDNINKGC